MAKQVMTLDCGRSIARQDVSCLDIVLQVVAGTLATAEQVSSIEGVVHVPANATGCCRQVAHPKLLSLQ